MNLYQSVTSSAKGHHNSTRSGASTDAEYGISSQYDRESVVTSSDRGMQDLSSDVEATAPRSGQANRSGRQQNTDLNGKECKSFFFFLLPLPCNLIQAICAFGNSRLLQREENTFFPYLILSLSFSSSLVFAFSIALTLFFLLITPSPLSLPLSLPLICLVAGWGLSSGLVWSVRHSATSESSPLFPSPHCLMARTLPWENKPHPVQVKALIQ